MYMEFFFLRLPPGASDSYSNESARFTFPLTPHHNTSEDHFLFRGSGRSLGRAQRADGEELYSFKPDIAHGGSFVYSEEELQETDDFTGSRAR